MNHVKQAVFFVSLLLIAGTAFVHAADRQIITANPPRLTVDLIQNGGCEMTLVGGNIPHWVEVVGTNWTQRQSNPSPWEGNHYFFPGAGASAELRQDVDVSAYLDLIDAGFQSFSFQGYVRVYQQSPADQSRIVVQYLNYDKSVVLSAYDSGDYSNTTHWQLLENVTVAPFGTRYIRVRLISTRLNGTNNDGYYDGISLTTVLPQPAAPQNPDIWMASGSILLEWDPVLTDTFGFPINVSSYDVHLGDTPDFICGPSTLIATVGTTSYPLPASVAILPRAFFKVIAIGGIAPP